MENKDVIKLSEEITYLKESIYAVISASKKGHLRDILDVLIVPLSTLSSAARKMEGDRVVDLINELVSTIGSQDDLVKDLSSSEKDFWIALVKFAVKLQRNFASSKRAKILARLDRMHKELADTREFIKLVVPSEYDSVVSFVDTLETCSSRIENLESKIEEISEYLDYY